MNEQPPGKAEDAGWMRAALALAARVLGRTAPNPAVGCVLVKDGVVLARAATAPGGRPHAETQALDRAGAMARGATAYVSLEPCAHHGVTPPCVDALIAAGVARVVIGCEDPDPRVAGQGIAALRSAGIAVEVGCLRADAEVLNAGFFHRIRDGRPLVTLKLATSLDGRIATKDGMSQWITGESARAQVHRLRASHDAVMVGINTALADNPDLTCRLPGLEDRSPLRIVLDNRLRLPLTSKLVATARERPTLILCGTAVEKARLRALTDLGVRVQQIDASQDQTLDIRAVLRALGEQGLTRVFVEGGARLAASLIRADLVDHLIWMAAPLVIGGDGLPAVAGWGVERLDHARRFTRLIHHSAGLDGVDVLGRLT